MIYEYSLYMIIPTTHMSHSKMVHCVWMYIRCTNPTIGRKSNSMNTVMKVSYLHPNAINIDELVKILSRKYCLSHGGFSLVWKITGYWCQDIYLDCLLQRASRLLIWNAGPGSARGIRSNSKFDQNLQCSGLKHTLPTTTKFCTRHHNVTVVTWRV